MPVAATAGVNSRGGNDQDHAIPAFQRVALTLLSAPRACAGANALTGPIHAVEGALDRPGR